MTESGENTVASISAESTAEAAQAAGEAAQPEIAQSERGPRRMRATFEQLRGEMGGEDFDERFRALRRWKAREMLSTRDASWPRDRRR